MKPTFRAFLAFKISCERADTRGAIITRLGYSRPFCEFKLEKCIQRLKKLARARANWLKFSFKRTIIENLREKRKPRV